MLIFDLQKEREILQQIRDHHLEKLFAWDNPSGVLICHKHANGIRWQKRDVENGHLITNELRKKEKNLAEKLTINLYRIICIQYIQKQLNILDALIRNQAVVVQTHEDASVHDCNNLQSFGRQEENRQFMTGQNSEVPVLETKKSSGARTSLNRAAWGNLMPEKSMQILLGKTRNCPHTPADFFAISSPYHQLIVPFLLKEYADIIEWYIGDYPRNNEYPERLQYAVKLGFKVRSKSEVIIADKLYEAGILFHYEEQLLLSENASYPDFFVPVTLVEKFAWEHFGAMDNDNYFHRTRGKIHTYLDHQWFPGINMITTYETRKQPLSEELVAHHVHWLKARYRMTFLDLPPDDSFNMYDLTAYAKSRSRSK